MTKADAERLLLIVRRNIDCAKLLADAAESAKPHQDVSDWIITIEFYVLCLYMTALAECRGMTFDRHYDLRMWINTDPDVRVAAKDYRKSEEWSREARYNGRLFTADEIERFNRRFRSVTNAVTPLLRGAGVAFVPSVEPLNYRPN